MVLFILSRRRPIVKPVFFDTIQIEMYWEIHNFCSLFIQNMACFFGEICYDVFGGGWRL
jgi:hypothetical protein